MKCKSVKFAISAIAIACIGQPVIASSDRDSCDQLPDFATLKSALVAAVADETSGLNNQMWATLVDRDGIVCAVAFSGNNRGAQWLGSRVISAQKANTGNAFSLDASSASNGSSIRQCSIMTGSVIFVNKFGYRRVVRIKARRNSCLKYGSLS